MQRMHHPGVTLTLSLAAFLTAGTVQAQGEPPPRDGAPQAPAAATGESEPEAPGLDEVLQLVREQKELIEKQQKTIDSLEDRLEKVESLALSAHNRVQELREQTPESMVDVAVQDRLAALESNIQDLPEKTELVSAGEFPGSFRIPGTDAALKIGGQVRFTSVHSLDALGSEDRFVTSSIPVEGTEEAGKESRINFIASPSRLNFDLRTPTGVGSMRAFVEADYAGPGDSFRLRHAFGQ